MSIPLYLQIDNILFYIYKYISINTMKQIGGLFSPKDNVIIHNKYILFILLFITMGNIYYLGLNNEYMYVFVFIFIAFLIQFFSKNMTIVLFLSVTLTNMLRMIDDTFQ